MRDHRAIVLMLCALAPATYAQVNPQSRPNFSGDWVLQSPAEPPPGTARRLTIEHDATFLSIAKTIGDRTEKVQHRLDSPIGGTVGRDGNSTFAGVWWFGDILRFDQGGYSVPPGTNGKFVERTEAWSLNDDGQLTIQITRASEAGRSRVTLVYMKHRKQAE